MEGFGYVCNCCACCCAILRGITDSGIDRSVAYANYYSTIDADAGTGCGVCVTRCQVTALSLDDGIAVVDQERCIGSACASQDAPPALRSFSGNRKKRSSTP